MFLLFWVFTVESNSTDFRDQVDQMSKEGRDNIYKGECVVYR